MKACVQKKAAKFANGGIAGGMDWLAARNAAARGDGAVQPVPWMPAASPVAGLNQQIAMGNAMSGLSNLDRQRLENPTGSGYTLPRGGVANGQVIVSPGSAAEASALDNRTSALTSLRDNLVGDKVSNLDPSRPLFADGGFLLADAGVKETPEQMLARMNAKYGLGDASKAASQPAPAPTANPQAAPAPGAGAATLTVTLCIETPWGSASKTLYTRSYSYGTMLPENDEIAPGKYAIPSPQIRAIFTPKYREQGSFFGAAYITKAEVANGATPAVLVNFVLSLETYSFIGADETDGIVHFIPCNLIEMLYAFVFSRRYGCDPDERYPVDDAATFAAIMAGLFSVQRNIQFRDGQMVDWLIGLGLPYFGNLKTELYRV